MKLDLNFRIVPFTVQFEQNEYQFKLAKDGNASVVMKDTLGAQYQTALWYSGNYICFSQITLSNIQF